MSADQSGTTTRECITHHYACDCRERKFGRLRAFVRAVADHPDLPEEMSKEARAVLNAEF